MSLLRLSFQNETLILDDLLYLYNLNAVRHSYLYESSLGGREAQKHRKRVRMLVVPFRSQNQLSGTFYGVSNFSGLPETQLVPVKVFFAQ